MLHIATVHWMSDEWIDIQLNYLKKHIDRPYTTYAYLNGIDAVHDAKFDHVFTDDIKSHATKLDRLADAIVQQAQDDDLMLFIDGDAFPVRPLCPFIDEKIQQHALLAVKREENLGDVQPHPCFCVTRVGFWKKIKGSWERGGVYWTNTQGDRVTDVGALLLEQLQKENADWYALLRSNKTDLHPLMFGLYDGLVYHHGAGFRKPAARLDKYLSKAFFKRRRLFQWSQKVLPKKLSKKWFSPYKPIIRKNQQISTEVFNKIREDHLFYRMFE